MKKEFEYQCMACGKPIPATGFCRKCDEKCREIELQSGNKSTPVFHKRESGFQFTQIMIKKIYRNSFVAEFKMKFPEVSNEIATSIHSDSVQGCISRVSKFFETELAPEEITVML